MSLQNGDDSPGYSESVWTNLVKWLHNKKGYKPEMLKEEEPMAAIRETFRILQGGVNSSITQETPPELTAALTENVFVFSGFKEHHELVEASRLLTDQNGDIKPFNRYLNDVRTLHEEYNKNYLRAEYNFAVRNSQMAVKWKEWEETGDRYLLQYRTAGDDRVRETHAVLDGTTLPMDDPFWDKYLPPLGWNCRCTTVQVRRGKYPESDSKEAVMKGENCTASVKQQIFRFNPGKVMKVFPPKHPYLPKGCGECDIKNLAYDKDSEQCRACKAIDKCLDLYFGKGKRVEAQKDLTQWYKANLPNIRVGKFMSKRFEVEFDGDKVILNKNSYNEFINKGKLGLDYIDKLSLSKKIHLNADKFKYQKGEDEKGRDHEDSIFKVYKGKIDGYNVRLKVKCNNDGNILWAMELF